jgi:hypothetical protein
MVKSDLQSFTEIESGLYYLDYIFAIEGSYMGLFYENTVPTTFCTFRVTTVASGGISVQEVRDAMKLTPTAGAPAVGSIDKHLDDVGGSGDTAVDENTGGADNLRYVYQSQGIDNATIKVYLKTDYDAGNRSDAYVKARSKTKTDGRWQWPIYLDSGFTYSIIFYKQGQYGPTKKEISIP